MWRHGPWQPSASTEPMHAGPHFVPEYDLPPFPDDQDPIVSDRPPGQGDFAMEGVDTFGKVNIKPFANSSLINSLDHNIYNFRRPDNMTYTNEGLIRGGFIGSALLYPFIAISIRTLEDHRQTHRVCPRLSIQATVRKLCHVHNVSVPYFVYISVVSNALIYISGHSIDIYAGSLVRPSMSILRSYTE